jgi:HSP20 family protein
MRTRINPVLPSTSVNNMVDTFFNKSIADIIGTDFTHNSPSVNIIEEHDAYVIELAAPGYEKKDFDISIEKDQLIISHSETKSEEHTESEEKVEHTHYTRREFNYAAFRRSFHLPKTIDKTSINATYKNGILALKLSKIEAAIDPGKIEIEIK